MKIAFALVVLLSACSARTDGGDSQQTPVPVSPLGMIGNWCSDDGECLKIESSNYGQNWMIYSWNLSDCREGGFVNINDIGQMNFGPLFHSCFTQAPVSYVISFTTDGHDRVSTEFSVAVPPLVLTRQ